MADIIEPGKTKVTLSAVYTLSDGTTKPADDVVWSEDSAALHLSLSSGASTDVLGDDLADGSLTAATVTASGSGFTATAEVDVQATTPAPTITALTVTSSGPEPV